VRITSSDGLSLEAQLDAPPDPRAALVFCHPHPQMGGTMNAPLLVALVEHLVKERWAVLRFNFRGIGSSEGTAGIGHEELADAEGAIAEMKKRYDLPLAIAGWSFGGAVAIRAAAAHDDLVAIVGIAPAVKEKQAITAGLPDPAGVSLPGELLVVVGANDELVDPRDARAWTEAAGGHFVEMRGANHFFWGKYEKLATEIAAFLEDAL
jgi:uncharacterized protein